MSIKSSIKKLLLQDEEKENPFEHIEYKTEEDEHPELNQPPTTRRELWSYYLYYNGNNGYTIYSYMPIILQYLAFRGGFDPNNPQIKGCDMNDTLKPCNINWIGAKNGIPVESMLLYVQAIAFSIQFVLFTAFGSLADYGKWSRYILLGSTLIGCATQILPIALVGDDGSHWSSMMAIMTIGLISYGASLVFYAAAFPSLSDNLPIVKNAKRDETLSDGEKLQITDKWRNHVSAISTTHSNIGFLVVSGLLSGISFIPWGGKYDFPPGVEQVFGNAPVFNYVGTVVCGAYWALFAVPYFLLQPKGRKGPPLPEGTNYFTIGWISIVAALREAKKLRYLFMYIFAYFMFSDAVSTIGQMTSIIQVQITSFSAKQNTLLGLITAVTSIIGCLFFLWFSKRFNISTKTNLLIIVVLTSMVPIWGCFGIHFDNFGIKTTGELWLINVWQGLFTAPIWAWQQTLLAELIPKGKENLFFGLFGIVNKASSWIGPVVIGAITQSTSSIWMGFPFVLGLFVTATIIICCIDMDKAKQELAEYENQSRKLQ